MDRKRTFFTGILVLMVVLVVPASASLSTEAGGAYFPTDWPGHWQMGPELDDAIIGCPPGSGFARFSGIYSPQQDRVYFLGGRCGDGSTTGEIFYFDLIDQSYHVMYEEMNIPVSNYQAVELVDATGIGFYIVGGRMGNSAHTDVIQVYYPATNTAVTLPTDAYPGGPMIVGGVVEVNNMMYVFGGYDGVNAHDETYVFDPMAAAGSRWTVTSCNLPSQRTYISAVAVGNRIYAVGGDFPSGDQLIPLSDTQVMDVTSPDDCWIDLLMADLPEPNGDAPAVYVGENALSGGIYVIGGTWPDPNRWVFRYDLATDTWESFPELAIPAPATGRRNQAAVYVPAISASGAGIWTFGGYDGDHTIMNNHMTRTSEYFTNPAHLTWPTWLPIVQK